jgi:2-C-methyl-D-erythritol 2,4-cyclodiphosphate synthase
MNQKVGLGYDIHAFAEGRKLFLGGIEIPYERGLDGHSDADVLLHAICDALLGAVGKGDIGEHFPNTDPAYKDISSLELLNQVNLIVFQQGYNIGNIDAVIIAEEPNIKNYKNQMCEIISKKLSISRDSINIKATTQEKLGSLGNKEGIAAHAIALVVKER